MERITICKNTFLDEQNQRCDLDYSMLICKDADGESYGVAIAKRDAGGIAEEERFLGISLRPARVQAFLRKLCRATALPVELAALCDDFISEEQLADAQDAMPSAV